MFHFWFHTSFVDKSGVLILPKSQIDKAAGDKKWKVYNKDFALELYFDILDKYVISDVNKPELKYTYQETFFLKSLKRMPRLFKQLQI